MEITSALIIKYLLGDRALYEDKALLDKVKAITLDHNENPTPRMLQVEEELYQSYLQGHLSERDTETFRYIHTSNQKSCSKQRWFAWCKTHGVDPYISTTFTPEA